MASFGALANPIGLLVGGTALLAAGLVYLGNKKDEARIKNRRVRFSIKRYCYQRFKRFPNQG